MNEFRTILIALGCVLGISGFATAASPLPNVVLIFVDDMGYSDIGPFGNDQVRTPHLDKFAAEGMRFTSFYATPVCSMSRACLLTGCYNIRVSIPGVLFPTDNIGLNPNEITLAEIVKQKGYATCAIGKWHLGHHPEFLPTRQGFDAYFGIPYSNDMGTKPTRPEFPPLPLVRGAATIEMEPDQSQLTQRYTEEAVKFIREHRDRPFLVYLPHTMIHFPLAASADFQGKSRMGLIGDTIEEIDWSVGQIMRTLDDEKLDSQTLVIFTSDNGPAGRSAAPLRGSKASTFEGGVREPCLMRWPGKIPAGTVCHEIAGNIDILPTLAKLVDVQPPDDRVIDGRDISPLMFDPKSGHIRDTQLYFHGSGQLQAIRQREWKLFLNLPTAPGQKAKAKAKAAEAKKAASLPPALFNLIEDVSESNDVARDHPEIVARLQKLAQEMESEIRANRRPAGQHAE